MRNAAACSFLCGALHAHFIPAPPSPALPYDAHSPRPHRRDYRAIGYGGVDAISIRASDPAFAASACGAALLSGGACSMRIAVHAFTSSIYAIMATSGRYVQLLDGQAQTDSVDANQWNYYRFSVLQAGQLVTFSVLPSAGDPGACPPPD